ncbi:MgtC/SapB family protein [Paludibacterium sp.]|uniref:MgtC/SapB family protein n=1 Tax=Paludibacterium sp. TaxID=1917523 RepID=UPI0025F29652|nr:MgtC/SapB family protein [Paludibacterium sp.]MBV8646824.1 MgtC/SapB family protein [Paludibacterium sp.]
MALLPPGELSSFWSDPIIATNVIVALNLLGALALGVILGYERTYHGRAAGMRTYGLVCMASTALTVVTGYSGDWFGGHLHAGMGDPTRVIQGIVTGIGFLGAGVIMKDGMSIRGLTSAASIWMSSAVGVLVGVGFYAAAIFLTLITVAAMIVISRLEAWLPSRQVIHMVLCFRQGFVPDETELRRVSLERGYEIDPDSLTIISKDGIAEWHFIAISVRRNQGETVAQLAQELAAVEGVVNFSMTRARN